MFQKPAFSSNTTSGFGSFNASTSAASPFGGFKATPGTSAFGAPPAFGASTSAQPSTSGGLFGAPSTSTGLFGSSAAPTSAPAFGTATSGFGFGPSTSTGGLFGQNNTSGGGLFGGAQNNTAFGAKPAGFGFGSTSTTATTGGGLFGSTPSTGIGLFGQQNNTMSGGGLFSSNTTAFGQQAPTGTAHVKYNPAVGSDVVVKGGASQNIIIKHHCITCMKEYENKSLEELRLEDYTAGRKGAAAGGMFGGFQATTENKPLFGGTTAFGQPATTSAPSVFGGGALNTSTGFGQPSTFSFGSNTQNTTNTSGLFGAAKPAFGATATTGTGLFGAASTQAPSFGTNTSSFGFGTNTQNQTTGLFGAKPATSGFGTTATTGFGGFGTTGPLFGSKPQQTTAPAFGSTAPAFGTLSTGFGATTSTASGGLFGQNNSFGKPAAQQPAFGFGNTQQNTLGGGLGTGYGASPFGAKPAAAPFGALGGSVFQQPANNTFRTGLDSGLGGGLFNNTSLGGNALGLGLNANTGTLNSNSLSGSAAGNVHEQILTAARPYGDSPLFKNLLPESSTTAEDVLKPTNPSAVKAVLESSGGYRVGSPSSHVKLHVRPASGHDKKSLFDGLEEADASLEDKLSLKPSRKRLVLRQKTAEDTPNDSIGQNNISTRSLEEPPPRPAEPEQTDDRGKRQGSYHENHNHEVSTDRHGSWLSSPKVQSGSWSENEKPIDNEPTPRLYPNLDKELPIPMAERRASWLTTKSLRKPLHANPESAENSVRELGVRPDRSHDKENIDTLSVSEEEHVPTRDAPPHPAGVKLTRPGYYTIPSLEEMTNYIRQDGRCVVPHLTIGRKNYGNVYFDCEIDVTGLDLDSLVYFLNKEIIVYPEDADKPPVGEELNRRAIVTLDRIWPRDKTEKRPVTEPDRLLKMDYEGKLRRVCDKHDTKFIEYRPQTGSWVFRVEHFSKYGLTDSDEEDDPTPDVLKRQLVSQNQLQKSAAIPPKPPIALSSPGLGGLGLGGLSAPSPGLSHGLLPEDNLLAMHQTSLNLLNGAGKAFDMDTTEDNAESQSLYQDHRAFGVKSPTSELARLEHRQSHNVQLMKASLYADADMEDDVSVSTGDQLVPLASAEAQAPLRAPTLITEEPQILDITPPPLITEEQPMKPLIVRPDTIVLKYHRKVPPFKDTIAGRLDAAYIADMSVCRARHSRVGFGPAGVIVFPTTYDSISDLPRNAELCDLGNYVEGRRSDDWSEPVVARLAIGQGDTASYLQEALSRHLETLLEYSESTPTGPEACPQLRVRPSSSDRLLLLQRHLRDAEALQKHSVQFGVSGAYCYEIWKLCDALWGADLENDGIPGTDVQSRVSQYKKLLEWFASAVSQTTDEELSKPRKGEDEDEADGHSSQVWTLLLGGRILEACKVSKENGDLNMATLIAQSAGDPLFRSLVARQISLWRECGADKLISSYRLATLRLIAGLSSPRDKLLEVDWLRALHATARYLCPQVPTLEQMMMKYTSFFTNSDDYDEIDLSTIEGDEMGMKYPLPPYCDEYEVVSENERVRRILDLRYELLRARSRNIRPTLRPASYTPDPLDYSLCFLLGTWFGNPTIESITGIADQLEACGLWHRAIQALAYHPNEIARGHLIRGVLCRHAPAQADCPPLAGRLQLVRRLQVPETWLLLAQAYRADYMNLPLVQAEHLVGACQWNAAHKVLLDKLLPDVVLSDNLQSISPLLEKMNEAAKRHEVSGWESGGQALYHYLHVCDEIRGLVSCASADGAGRSGVADKLEALRPLVSAACRALQQLQPQSARHAAARTEMGSRLVQLALAAGEPPHHLAALLKALKLPPDCTAHAQHKITTDLAEQASELCIESVTSSPISSHHRATVQS